MTARQAASAAARERPSGNRETASAFCGVSHADNINLAVRPPVSVATDVDLLFVTRTCLAARPGLNERCGVVVYGRASARPSASLGPIELRCAKEDRNAQHCRRPGTRSEPGAPARLPAGQAWTKQTSGGAPPAAHLVKFTQRGLTGPAGGRLGHCRRRMAAMTCAGATWSRYRAVTPLFACRPMRTNGRKSGASGALLATLGG